MAKVLYWRLADHHGPWCPWCLDYFDPALLDNELRAWRKPAPELSDPATAMEAHHVLPQHMGGRLVGVVSRRPPMFDISFLRAWTIDVHHRCHRGSSTAGLKLQAMAESTAANLATLLTKAQELTRDLPQEEFDAMDEEVRRAFDSGRYPIALLLNEAVRGAREDGDEWGLASETLNYQLSARAGIAGLKPLNLDDFCGSGCRPSPVPGCMLQVIRATGANLRRPKRLLTERAASRRRRSISAST